MANLIPPVEWDRYERISDDVYELGYNITLRFNVVLSKYDKNKQIRYNYHREFEYSSKTENVPIRLIRRVFDYYYSIDYTKSSNYSERISIRIGPQEIGLLLNGLEEATSWFINKHWEYLFSKNKSGKLELINPIPDINILGFPFGKIIRIIPIIVEYATGSIEQEAGVKFSLLNEVGAEVAFVNMSLNKLMGLKYILTNSNMFLSAQTMLNYIERPELGTNLIRYNNDKEYPKK